MMGNDKMREDFEAWWLSLANHWPDGSTKVSAWQAWQASRAAVVVKLPHFVGAFPKTQEYVRNECAKCIEAAGLKVAP